MKIKDAAMQAFPFIEPAVDDAVKAYHPGITLRDYFAAKAMQGIIASFPTSLPPSVTASEAAYQYADAMLKARN